MAADQTIDEMAETLAGSNGAADAGNPREFIISPPNFQIGKFEIIGVAPYVQNKFSGKARAQMRAKQEAGSVAKKGVKREAKDFQACYEAAKHYIRLYADPTKTGLCGIPAPSFRNSMISACRLVDFKMTQAKLAIFVEADGVDPDDGTPLVLITKGEPHYVEHAVRNESGVCDVRARPMWDDGWRAIVRIRFDADRFTAIDIMNLLARAGQQVGIGEGRPDSKESCGMGWGLFRPITPEERQKESA